MKIMDLDENKLTQILLMAPILANNENHQLIKTAMKEYRITPGNSLEIEFAKDLFGLTTDEIIIKWYDGNFDITGLFFKSN
ncbi:hypothetical protein ACQKGI_22005 [Peribacillus muralis]|uniref:hypothetical protein n=1 Tax=Peribacillus muralis TaxID=264697 RepID=UPI00382693BD